MTVATPSRTSEPTNREIEEMARRLDSLLKRSFPRLGSQGSGTGIFSEIGRGDGSLHDSFREADEDDDWEHYHDPLNGLQPPTGPFYVHTRANRYEQRGVFIPDMPASRQMGSYSALYTRQQVAIITAKIMLRLMHRRGQLPGLILPGINRGVQVSFPGAPEAGLLRKLDVAGKTKQEDGLELCLESASKLAANLEFAVVVSDFMAPGWEPRLRNIGRRLELLVFQIIDPDDLELPDIKGKLRVRQAGQTVVVDAGNPRKRRNYRELAQRRQAKIARAVKQARGQHYRLMTDRPLVDQLLEIFGSPGFQQRNLD